MYLISLKKNSHSLIYSRSYRTFSKQRISYLHHVDIHMFHQPLISDTRCLDTKNV